jgi:hypothetical protein
MLLLDDDDELPPQPNEAEARLSSELGDARLQAIDHAIRQSARPRWLKVARVVIDALKAGSFDTPDDATIHLHVRRLISLVEFGTLESQGNLRRPRWSEVRLRS